MAVTVVAAATAAPHCEVGVTVAVIATMTVAVIATMTVAVIMTMSVAMAMPKTVLRVVLGTMPVIMPVVVGKAVEKPSGKHCG
jgi:hypothetical protein